MTEQEERKRGILTPADRRYLRGDEELTEGSEYNTRRRIRERVRNSILDFAILYDHLDESDRSKIFKTDEGAWRAWEDAELHNGLRDTLALVFREGIIEQHISPYDTARGLPAQVLFEEAVRRVSVEKGFLVKDIGQLGEIITAERIPWPNLENSLQDGKELPNDAIRLLLEHEQVDSAAVQEQLREMIFGEESE